MSSTFKRTRKRKDGTTYEVWVCEEKYNGTTKTLTGKTEKEAKAKMKAWLKEMIIYGEKLSKSNDNFQTYFNTYLFDKVLNDVESSTFTRYKGIYDKYIMDSSIGKMKIDAITYTDIQLFFNDLRELSTATMNKTKSLLNGCFKYAKQNNLIRSNPMDDFTVPKSKKRTKEIRIMTIDEQSRYLKALSDSPMRPLLLLTMFTGIRLGELISLKWNDVFESEGYIKIESSLKRTKVYNKDGSYITDDVTKTTKTNKSRCIPIPDFIVNELKFMDHSTDYVFVTSKGTHYTSENIQREHTRVCTAAKIGEPTTRIYHRTYKHKDGTVKKVAISKIEYLDINFHALRHTYATRLFNYGENAKIIQSLLGHSRLSTTMDIYTHILDHDKQNVTVKLDKIYNDIL